MLRVTQEETDIIVDIKRVYRGDTREYFKESRVVRWWMESESISMSLLWSQVVLILRCPSRWTVIH